MALISSSLSSSETGTSGVSGMGRVSETAAGARPISPVATKTVSVTQWRSIWHKNPTYIDSTVEDYWIFQKYSLHWVCWAEGRRTNYQNSQCWQAYQSKPIRICCLMLKKEKINVSMIELCLQDSHGTWICSTLQHIVYGTAFHQER